MWEPQPLATPRTSTACTLITLHLHLFFQNKESRLQLKHGTKNIHGVPGGKFSILGGHIIGHSKQKLYMHMCPIPNGFQDRATSLDSSKIVDKKEILRAVSNTGVYCSSDKAGTVYLV
jgi:hypothetical protein